MNATDEVRTVSSKFYAALSAMANGDAGGLADVWAHGPEVTTMHPIGGREVGWTAVRESFEQVAQLASGGGVELADQWIQVGGDVAYEAGVERGAITMAGETVEIDQRVTNIYRRDDGVWKMVHHHADISPAMLDLLHRLQNG